MLLAGIVYMIAKASVPAIRNHGLSLIASSTWDPTRDDAPQFGLSRFLSSKTTYSSFFALLIATVFGVAIAIFLSQRFLPRKLEIVFKNIVELLAAVPSVVYGLGRLSFVIIPLLRSVTQHFAPVFHGYVTGPSLLPRRPRAGDHGPSHHQRSHTTPSPPVHPEAQGAIRN